MNVARVFPRRTRATPTDDLAFVGDPPLFLPHADEVHISCTFTWDRPEAQRLAQAWAEQDYRVRLGGPAYGSAAGEFEPGMYVKQGMTITSRGCIRSCPFCFVPRREGRLMLLPIRPGWDVLDNNLLACPRRHVEAVLGMLEDQPRAARFTGGIDARLCRPWFARRLGRMRVQILYTAFDHPDQRPHGFEDFTHPFREKPGSSGPVLVQANRVLLRVSRPERRLDPHGQHHAAVRLRVVSGIALLDEQEV